MAGDRVSGRGSNQSDSFSTPPHTPTQPLNEPDQLDPESIQSNPPVVAEIADLNLDSSNTSDLTPASPMDMEESEEEGDDSEIEFLDRQLDELNNFLDGLERQNDTLTAQLRDLLESNRQARLEFNELQQDDTTKNTDKKSST